MTWASPSAEAPRLAAPSRPQSRRGPAMPAAAPSAGTLPARPRRHPLLANTGVRPAPARGVRPCSLQPLSSPGSTPSRLLAQGASRPGPPDRGRRSLRGGTQSPAQRRLLHVPRRARAWPRGLAGVFVHSNHAFRASLADGRHADDHGRPRHRHCPASRLSAAERRATGAAGKNWLALGDQRAATDFLYRDELLGYQGDGHLTRLDVAFSRDQPEKIYVQSRMLNTRGGAFAPGWRPARIFTSAEMPLRMAKDVFDCAPSMPWSPPLPANLPDEGRRLRPVAPGREAPCSATCIDMVALPPEEWPASAARRAAGRAAKRLANAGRQAPRTPSSRSGPGRADRKYICRPGPGLTAPATGGAICSLEVSLDACTGCKACVAACHSLNGLDEHETWRDVGLLVGGDHRQPVSTNGHYGLPSLCRSGLSERVSGPRV